jgi:hypothetical protein
VSSVWESVWEQTATGVEKEQEMVLMKTKWIIIVLLVCLLSGVASADVLTTSQFGAGTSVDGNPIGGGTGYSDIKTTGDCIATTSATLISCLASVTYGQVIYVPETAEINMTDVSPTFTDTTTIPAGITIASNRGYNGSSGGRIFKLGETSDNGYIMFTAGGDNVRFTGLRIESDHTTIDHGPREKTGISNGNQFTGVGYKGFQVDNCEISGWSITGILIHHLNSTSITEGITTPEIGSSIANIHHNYIHNNVGSGYGYGVAVFDGSALVKGNVFSKNRHSVESSGVDGSGYEASYNVHLSGTPGNYGHIFDAHGDPRDGCDAGTLYRIHHNTVLSNLSQDVIIAGDPRQSAVITNNIFKNNTIVGSGAFVSFASRGTTNNITMQHNVIDEGYFAGSTELHYEGYTR